MRQYPSLLYATSASWYYKKRRTEQILCRERETYTPIVLEAELEIAFAELLRMHILFSKGIQMFSDP